MIIDFDVRRDGRRQCPGSSPARRRRAAIASQQQRAANAAFSHVEPGPQRDPGQRQSGQHEPPRRMAAQRGPAGVIGSATAANIRCSRRDAVDAQQRTGRPPRPAKRDTGREVVDAMAADRVDQARTSAAASSSTTAESHAARLPAPADRMPPRCSKPYVAGERHGEVVQRRERRPSPPRRPAASSADRAVAAREEVGDLRMVLDAGRIAVARRVVGRLIVRRRGAQRQMGARRGKDLFVEHAATTAVCGLETLT